MNPLRIALVTPRYWPHGGDAEIAASQLAVGLQAAGARVTVLTGAWGNNWPPQLTAQGVPVVRVPHAPRGGWNTLRYLLAVGRWLRRQRDQFDRVLVMNLRYEAYVAVRVLRDTRLPVALASLSGGPVPDWVWQRHAALGNRVQQACRDAAAIIVPDPVAAAELASSGYDPLRVHVVPPGVADYEPRSADRRFRARAALAEINYDFAVAEYAPVAIYVGRLDDLPALTRLISEWQLVALRWPSARLWFLGEGFARDALQDLVADLDLRPQTIFPGVFAEWTDLFQAADVLVIPTPGGDSQVLLEGLAAGLPVVATDSPSRRGMMVDGTHGILIPGAARGAWTAALSQLFEAPSLAARLGAAGREWVRARFAGREQATAQLAVLTSLTNRHDATASA